MQFHWQRGERSASRQPHPSGSDNAPANATRGVWLRLLSPMAGADWGGHLVPRPGQEVLIAFQHGNIDRPVVIGALYNGEGNPDGAGNRLAGGTQHATANAPAWFAGRSDPAHTHRASLSGIKTQELSASRSGQGGYNQLVFDDTANEARIELSTTQHDTRLQLGHLKQQSGNAREASRGHGAELATRAALATRAGSGLLVSADARPGAHGPHLDSREAIERTDEARDLVHGLAATAHKHHAGLSGDDAPDSLPATTSLEHALDVLRSTAERQDTDAGASPSGFLAAGGGTGTVPAWSAPRIQHSAPAGIAQLTPQDVILAAGQNLVTASGDAQFVSQGNHAMAIAHGLALFTIGKASAGQKPNTETGIHLHAASGQVSVQSQRGKLSAAADKRVTVASTNAALSASARKHILATAQGAYLRIEGGNIQLHAPGKVALKASRKNLTGPKAVAVTLPSSPKPNNLKFSESGRYSQRVNVAGLIGGDPLEQSLHASLPYEAYNEQGTLIAAGQLNADGTTGTLYTHQPEKLKVVISHGDWQFFLDVSHL
ncbi:DUF2345 domain-containing protein [Aromatoleum evansii]|uniref:DUF2345 domain-containing protein n=1 Tax=Aromatoleum evansii TaxID=59406 RepID=UPI0030DD7981